MSFDSSIDRVEKYQKTVKEIVTVEGSALFTGERVKVTIKPAPENYGIVFRRIDVKGMPYIPAFIDYVKHTSKTTVLEKEGVSLQTIEHLLSALWGLEIDNALIEINGPELPIGDGSAQLFVRSIQRGGIEVQSMKREPIYLTHPVYWSQDRVHIVAIPSHVSRISYTMHFPKSTLLRSQYFTMTLEEDSYIKDIAPARTFSIYEDIEPLIKKGFFKGGGLDNAVVIKEDKIVNPEGLRYFDEMVRHKVLDLVGDLALIGRPLVAHIIAICSGHFSNIEFARKLVKSGGKN